MICNLSNILNEIKSSSQIQAWHLLTLNSSRLFYSWIIISVLCLAKSVCWLVWLHLPVFPCGLSHVSVYCWWICTLIRLEIELRKKNWERNRLTGRVMRRNSGSESFVVSVNTSLSVICDPKDGQNSGRFRALALLHGGNRFFQICCELSQKW